MEIDLVRLCVNAQDIPTVVRWLAVIYMMFAILNIGLIFERRSVLN